MYGIKLAISTLHGIELNDIEQLPLIKAAGFDGFFFCWKRGVDSLAIKARADELSLTLQSVHAPFLQSAKMWLPREEASDAINELLECLEECKKIGAPIKECHTFIGFKDHSPTKEGIENFGVIVARAKEYGIKIAFENTEGREYLDALMDAFRGDDTVGFCYDTGHEQCYNRGERMLRHFGDRLLCTHINDNLGVKDFFGEITFLDDLHLLPFDGIIDWQETAREIAESGFDGFLTFELLTTSKPNRYENDKYARLSTTEYLFEAYARAVRVATLVKRERERITNSSF